MESVPLPVPPNNGTMDGIRRPRSAAGRDGNGRRSCIVGDTSSPEPSENASTRLGSFAGTGKSEAEKVPVALVDFGFVNTRRMRKTLRGARTAGKAHFHGTRLKTVETLLLFKHLYASS